MGKGNDKGRHGEVHGNRAWLEDEGVLSGDRLTCSHCSQGGEEDWCVRDPRPCAHQDQDKASNQGGCEDDVWCGAEGEGKASKDSCESLCSCRTQKPDLDERIVICVGVT